MSAQDIDKDRLITFYQQRLVAMAQDIALLQQQISIGAGCACRPVMRCAHHQATYEALLGTFQHRGREASA